MTPSGWDSVADFWIHRCRDGDANREGMLDEWMLRTIGDPSGLRVIDLGCGEGRFCRRLAALGAESVLGVDTCEALLVEALRRRTSPAESYRRDDMCVLGTVANAVMDLAVSYISLVDVPDHAGACSAAFRVLRPGGRLVVCNLAAMATASPGRLVEPDGARIALRVDRYFDESERPLRFGDHTVIDYHRTLSTQVNDFIDAGFTLAGVHEPRPTAEAVAKYPELVNELRAPIFILYDLRRP